MPNVHFSFRRGAGDVPEILYGKVEIKPTLAFARGTSLVLPAPTTLDLVNGEATVNNVYPTPAPVAGQVEWAYRVKAIDTRGQSFEWMVGVPDSTGTVEFTSLPRYFETKPPLFGKGEKGDPGEAAKITVGTTTSGTTPSVTNSGTNQNAILNFVLPQGPQGPKGDGTFDEYRSANGQPPYRSASDAPNTYPKGLITGLYVSAEGWPHNPFSNVTTFSGAYGASKTQIATPYNGASGEPLIRYGLNSTTWTPFKPLRGELVTSSTNGLMSSADKAKLDGIGTLAYASKKASDLAETYPEGTTVGAFKTSDGWPVIQGGDPDTVTVKTEVPRGYPIATQWAYAYKNDTAELETSSPVMYRAGFGALGWGAWQTIPTMGQIKADNGVLNAADYDNFQAAIDDAFAKKKPLVVSSDLEALSLDYKFFQIQTLGKGSVTVDGNKFWVNPQHQGIQTNVIYINPTTGNDNNSGISPNAPVKTFARLNTYLSMLRDKLLDGFWEVVIQQGVHTLASGWRMDGLRTKWPLVIRGEGTLNTIIDGGSDTLGKFIYFKHFETAVTVKNLLVRNYRGEGSTGDGIDTNAGVLVQGPGIIRIEDCRFVDCTTAVSIGYAASGTVLRSNFLGDIDRSPLSSTHTGIVALYGASLTVGTKDNANTFIRCYQGVHVTRNAVAHVDYNTHQNCYIGLSVSHNARAAVLDGNFWGNMVGIDMTGGGEATFATANFGTASTANVEHNVRFAGTSRFTQFQGQYPSTNEYRLATSVNVPPITPASGIGRTLVATLLSSNNIPANLLYGLNKKIRFTMAGNISGTGSRKFIWRKNDRDGANATDISTVTIPSNYTGNFTWEAEVHKSAVGGNFRIIHKLLVSGNPPIISTEYITGVDITHDWIFRIYKEDSAAGLTNQIITHEIYVSG